jgi:hypothetical protein
LNIGDPSLKESTVNNAPSLNITSPSPDVVISGNTAFRVDANDDIGVAKVSFYIGNNLIGEDSTSPYEATINSSAYPNGSYTLKAVVTDGSLTAEKTLNVKFENQSVDTEKPSISISSPESSPYTLTSDSLDIKIDASDNTAIDRIEFYFEGELQDTWKTNRLKLNASFASLSAGTYSLSFKAYDTAGNLSEATLTIIKP